MTYKQLFEKYFKRSRGQQYSRIVFAGLNIVGAIIVLRDLKKDVDSINE